MTSGSASAHDAILLAGGRASRLGGIDKTGLLSGGSSLLDLALIAAGGARRVVVVGLREGRSVPQQVLQTREDPPLAGPVAAIGAGLRALDGDAAKTDSTPWTLVLACDLVRPAAAVEALLIAATPPPAPATPPTDGFIAVDETGHRQPLLALYRSDALRTAIAEASRTNPNLANLSMRRLLAPMRLTEVSLPSELCADVDEPDDAAALDPSTTPDTTSSTDHQPNPA